jgi:N-dimethylarginine dimethylaminohydrolase
MSSAIPEISSQLAWGVDSEHGVLRDVLLCSPEYFRWLPTSAISQGTLDSGARFDRDLALRQHREMVACYEQEGVSCHFLKPDPALPYQVFTRDSSTGSPAGGIVLALQQGWRRGEYAAVADFYRSAGIPLAGTITAAAVEGGDVMIVEPGCVLIGCGETRTQEQGATQLAALFGEMGWEARVQPFPARYVHLDVVYATLGEKLGAVCPAAAPASLISWLRSKGFDLIEVPDDEAFALGVNAMSLGADRVLSSFDGRTLNAALRARGVTVLDPTLSMFTAGGGGAHCMAQALRRERCA